jgi:hypothetical protein
MSLQKIAQKFTTTIHVFSVGTMKFLSSTLEIGIGAPSIKEQKNNTFVKGQLHHYKFLINYIYDKFRKF